MNRKTLVPAATSRTLRTFALPREVLLELIPRIHNEVARDHNQFRNRRLEDDRLYRHSLTVSEANGTRHFFTLIVDDATSAEHLIIMQIHHVSRPAS